MVFVLFPLVGLATCVPSPNETRALDLHLYGNYIKADFETLIIPIKRINRLLVIEARVDTLVGNFILDTGAPGLVLNNTYFRKYWVSSDFIASNAANTAAGPVRNTWVNELEVKELRLEQLKARLTELGHIENRSNTRILGLLGVSILKSFTVTIDLQQNVLILQRTDKAGRPMHELENLKGKTPINKSTFKLVNNSILLPTHVAGQKLLFCLDTGAETNVLSSTVPQKVLSTFRVARRSVLLGTGGASVEVLAGKLDKITIGHVTYYNMNTIVSNLDGLGQAYGESIQGMIGFDLLNKGIISINFVKKELCIYPYTNSTDE
jgi:predicted aspartyl protease